jgi:hypothetical protein
MKVDWDAGIVNKTGCEIECEASDWNWRKRGSIPSNTAKLGFFLEILLTPPANFRRVYA